MNFTEKNVSDQHLTLTIKIEEKDYKDKVEKELKKLRQKAEFPGFRPGKAPLGLVNKKYGKEVKNEQIVRTASESLNEYLQDNNINIIGRPLAHKDQQQNFDKENEFEFSFDIGIAPDFEVDFSDEDVFIEYEINPDKKFIDDNVLNYRKQFGEYVEGEKIEEESLVKGSFVELDDDKKVKENGHIAEETSFLVKSIKDEDFKKKFIGADKDKKIDVDVKKAFPNETDLGGMLKIDKEKLEDLNSNFRFEIKQISNFKDADLDQEFFDKVYGKDEVKSEEEFRERLALDLKTQLKGESNYKFYLDAKEKMLDKIKFDLPDEFMKKLVLENGKETNNKDATPEKIEEEYPEMKENFRWQLIINKIIEDEKIEATEEEILELAKMQVRNYMYQYYQTNLPEEYIEESAKQMLEKERTNLEGKILEDKAVRNIKEKVNIEKKEIESGKFNDLLTKQTKK